MYITNGFILINFHFTKISLKFPKQNVLKVVSLISSSQNLNLYRSNYYENVEQYFE